MHHAIDEVRAFIVERNPQLDSLGMDDDLIDSRAIDSLAFVDFIFFLEQLGGQPIDPEELGVDDFRTLRVMEKRFLGGGR
jgi:acyl carrier protein